jgi:hypothetical protein
MRTLIVFLLLCVSALAANTGLRLVSTVTTTNRMGVDTTETFTRGGQTNLVRVTESQGGVVGYLHHAFCHHGDLVAFIIGTPDPVSFDLKQGLPYQVSLQFWPSNGVRNLSICGEDFNEVFYATNGVFYPAPDSDLEIEDYRR